MPAMYTLDDFKQRDIHDQQSLTQALAWASRKYYVDNDPPMSDYEYDMEYRQLQALEQASHTVLPNSPTQRVGSDLQGGFEKHVHLIPMQSIENVYSDVELQEWIRTTTARLHASFPHDEVSFTIEPKYDGLSISLVYQHGQLVDAVTRGNQLVGESVWANVRTIRNVPLSLPEVFTLPEAADSLFSQVSLPEYFEVRGEVLMPEGAFERLNKARTAAGERPFANKRNAASGSLKQLDPKVTAQRGLLVNAYAAYSTDLAFEREVLSSQATTLAVLDTLGFERYVSPEAPYYASTESLLKAIDRLNAVRTSGTLPYDCDGIVVKVNQRSHQTALGLGTTAPNWCRARKFPQEARSTQMTGVTFQVGMTGHITPVAELDPTAISGSVVARATLNNASFIQQMGLHIGDYVFIHKAGEVIPQVVGIDKERTAEAVAETSDIIFPSHCPCCGSPLVRKGEFWVCTGKNNCKEQAIGRLAYWCSKDCANIKGLGTAVLSDFYDRLHIATVDDLYRVFIQEADAFEPSVFCPSYTTYLLHLLGQGYAQKSVVTLTQQIRQSVDALTLDRIIGGLPIDGVGKITGRLLAEHFGSWERFRAATLEELITVDGIGEITARAILEADLSNYSVLQQLPFALSYQAQTPVGNELDGLTLLFTGTSYRLRREEIKTFLALHGARYVGSVSAKLSYLIVGDAPGQNKVDKARALGIPILNERDFYERFQL